MIRTDNRPIIQDILKFMEFRMEARRKRRRRLFGISQSNPINGESAREETNGEEEYPYWQSGVVIRGQLGAMI